MCARLDEYRHAGPRALPRTMRAVVLSGRGLQSIACTTADVPTPGPDQLLCRVDAAGVCTSILKIAEQGAEHTYFHGWDPARWPVILGDEGSLTVMVAGANLADRYRPGQRLGLQPACDSPPINWRERYRDGGRAMKKTAVGYTLGGCLAEYLLVGEEVLRSGSLVPLPDDSLPYFAVSMGEPISCVISAQERQFHLYCPSPLSPRQARLGLLPGGTTVVIGLGPMGLMHAELALRYRPKHLLACDRIAARLERALRTVGPRAQRAGVNFVAVPADQLKARVMELTGGAGADDIILAVGIQEVQQQALELLGRGGVANLFGGLPRGRHMLQVDAIRVHYDEIKLVGSSGGSPGDLAGSLRAIAAGEIDPGNYVCAIADLEHVPEVLAMIRDNRVEGKVIIYPHARAGRLMPVEYWDGRRESEFLEQHL